MKPQGADWRLFRAAGSGNSPELKQRPQRRRPGRAVGTAPCWCDTCRRGARGGGKEGGLREVQLTVCAISAGTGTLTSPQTGLGYHKSVWKKKTRTSNLATWPFELGPRPADLCFVQESRPGKSTPGKSPHLQNPASPGPGPSPKKKAQHQETEK